MKKWLSVKEVSFYIGVSEITIYRRMKRKRIPFYKVGKLARFNSKEIDKWIVGGCKKWKVK